MKMAGTESMEPAALRAWAEAETGMTDLGGAEAERAFGRLATAMSMIPAARGDDAEKLERLRNLLVDRLAYVRDRTSHPGITDERVDSPIFVLGLARSGTTLLQVLLAEDPAHRAPLLWETMLPSPPPSLVDP